MKSRFCFVTWLVVLIFVSLGSLAFAQRAAIDFSSVGSGNWDASTTWSCNGSTCAANTWPGQVAGDTATINSGHTVTFDVNGTQELGVTPTACSSTTQPPGCTGWTGFKAGVTVSGTLKFHRTLNTSLTTNFLGVQNGGCLDMGISTDPITANATINLRGKTPAAYLGGHDYCPSDLGLQVQGGTPGGKWMAYGKTLGSSTPLTFTSLTSTANSGATSITVNGNVTNGTGGAQWNIGDQIVISQTDTTSECNNNCAVNCSPPNPPTNTYQDQNERRTISAMSFSGGITTITLNSALLYTHEVTTDPGKINLGITRESQVINITRNIKITSIDYNTCPSHTLISQTAQASTLAFVEFLQLGSKVRADQSEPNKYPLHYHPGNGNFQGLAFHDSKRAHMVLHRGSNNTVKYNTFHDVFTFQGASIWLAFPTGETIATTNNDIENNALLLPPRTCYISPGDLNLSITTPFVTALYITHPAQTIKFTKAAGGFYSYYYNFEALPPNTFPSPNLGTYDSNTTAVGGQGLVLDSRATPYRPATQQQMTNFKIWGYDTDIIVFDWNNVSLVDFKIFDPRDSGIQVDFAAGDTTTDTITITGNDPSTGSTGSVLSGNFDPTTGTGTQNALVCLKEDGLKMNG